MLIFSSWNFGESKYWYRLSCYTHMYSAYNVSYSVMGRRKYVYPEYSRLRLVEFDWNAYFSWHSTFCHSCTEKKRNDVLEWKLTFSRSLYLEKDGVTLQSRTPNREWQRFPISSCGVITNHNLDIMRLHLYVTLNTFSVLFIIR